MKNFIVDEKVGAVLHISGTRDLELGEVGALCYMRWVPVPSVARVNLVPGASMRLRRCLRSTSETCQDNNMLAFHMIAAHYCLRKHAPRMRMRSTFTNSDNPVGGIGRDVAAFCHVESAELIPVVDS